MKKHKHIALATLSLAATIGLLGLVLSRTRPDELGPMFLGVFFGLVLLSIMQLVSLGGRLLAYVRGGQFDFRGSLMMGVGVGLPLVMLLALNTIRQVGVVDTALAFVFGATLLFYLKKR